MRSLLALLVAFCTLTGRAQTPCDVTLTGTPITCPGDDNGTLTVLAGTPGLYTYVWAHDGIATGATVTALEPGPYSVVVTDTSGCESVLDTVITDPGVPPLGSFTYTNISCAGANDATLTLTLNPGGPYNFFWIAPAGATGTTLTGLGPGIYSVSISGPVGCPSYPSQEIGDPGITILGITDYCPSDPPVLTAELEWGFEPDVYVWSTTDSTNSIQVPAGLTGTVDLTATDTSLGCVVNAQVVLNELPSPTVAFVAPDTTCVNVLTLVHTTVSTADSLVWRWPETGFSNELDPLIHFTQPGWMPVTLQGYDSLGCGSLAVLDSIYAQYQVPAILTVMQDPCSRFVDIVLGSSTDSCAFFIGDSLITNECAAYFHYDMLRYAEYTYTLYATQANGCNDTTTVTVDVRTEPTLFLANAFTPNGDGINDLWPARVDIADTDYELHVYDRWGVEVWSTIDPLEEWDGEAGGGPLPTGVYAYTTRMLDPCEPTNHLVGKGHVTLFR
ncbi:MAG: gliding motility-associated C-terminal domain-containing protein [Flavobacteriales bacterium]